MTHSTLDGPPPVTLRPPEGGAEHDLVVQLRHVVTALRETTGTESLTEIVLAGANWELNRGQKLFGSLTELGWLAGLPELSRYRGCSNSEQQQAFVAGMDELLRTGMLPASADARTDSAAERFLAEAG